MTKKKIPVRKMCRDLGGDYDINTETCNISMDDPEHPSSVLGGNSFWYFAFQVIVGSSSAVVISFFRNVRQPTIWWTNFLILATFVLIALGFHYWKLGSVKEALSRTLLSLIIIYAFSLLIGIMHEGDVFIYLDIVEFSRFPTSAAIAGIIVSTGISFFLTPPSERKGEDTLNDFDEFQDTVVT